MITRMRLIVRKFNQNGEIFQIMAIITGSLSIMSCGIFYSWPSPTIPEIISDDFPETITLEEASYLTVIPQLVAMVSCPLTSLFLDKIGRKYCILASAIPHMLAWITIYSSNSIWFLYLSRVFAGMSDGCLFSALPSYIGEITTPQVRGPWSAILPFSIYFGQTLANIVGGYLGMKTSSLVLLAIPVFFLVTFSWMPESPYYLLMKDRQEDARKSLRRLRQKEHVEDELKQLTLDVARQTSERGTLLELFTIEANRKALYISAFLRAAQIFCGSAAFTVYAQYIFQLAGGSVSAIESSIIFTGTLTILTPFAGFLVEKLGRNLSMVISNAGCTIILFLEAIFFYLNDFTDVDLESFRWFPIVGMTIFIVAYSVGLGIVPTLMLTELFSSSIKGKGLAVLNICFDVYIIVATKLFQFLVSRYGLYVPFLFFAACAGVSAIVSYFLVPETKGKTLEEIQQSFKS